MFITVEDVLALPELQSVELIAGAQGLKRSLQLLHVLESNEGGSDFIRTGELIFVTGVGLRRGTEDLLELLQKSIMRNAAGMIINIGPYIQAVDPKVIALADECDFPVFVIPWKVNLAAIIQCVYQYIFRKNYEEDTAEALLLAALYGDITVNYELYQAKAQAVDLDLSQRYRVVCCRASQVVNKAFDRQGYRDPSEELLKASWKRCMADTFKSFQRPSLVFMKGQDSVIIVPVSDLAVPFRSVMERLRAQLEGDFFCQSLAISWGDVYDIHDLKQSLDEAKFALTFCPDQQGGMMGFSELGFFKVLFDIKSEQTLYRFCDDVLGKLIRYDQEHGTDLLHTLTVYFQAGRNLQQSAQVLVVHSNTIKYRLHKISELLSVNMAEPKEYEPLIFALKVQEYLAITNKNKEQLPD